MRIWKKKALWYILYGVVITLVFLFVLFPAEAVKSRIETAAAARNLALQAEALKPSFPLGIQFQNLSLSLAGQRETFFKGETLDLQANILSLVQKHPSARFSGKAYGGRFDGQMAFFSFQKIYPPAAASFNFQSIDLGKYPLIRQELGKPVTGKIGGTIAYGNDYETISGINGSLFITLTKGSYPLAESFLGSGRIEIDRGEVRAQLKNGVLKLEKMDMFGPQINCFLKGNITLAQDWKNSQLNLTGVVEILSKSKVKTNITINGTLANPISRYI